MKNLFSNNKRSFVHQKLNLLNEVVRIDLRKIYFNWNVQILEHTENVSIQIFYCIYRDLVVDWLAVGLKSITCARDNPREGRSF